MQSVERLESLGEGQETRVDDRADGRVVVKGDDRVHLLSQRDALYGSKPAMRYVS